MTGNVSGGRIDANGTGTIAGTVSGATDISVGLGERLTIGSLAGPGSTLRFGVTLDAGAADAGRLEIAGAITGTYQLVFTDLTDQTADCETRVT